MSSVARNNHDSQPMPTHQDVGILYCVATPIGNLQDFTPRAISVLQQVDVIAAEDTRHSQPLLQHYSIDTPLIAYHDHNAQSRTAQLVARLQSGQSVALISDAGTPLVSDPGYQLIDAAHTHGIKVVPIVGACAAIAALSVAGLPSDQFSFIGFLPAKMQARQRKLASLTQRPETLIFYEAPHRILACLQDMQEAFGAQRMACLCREMTKTFETVVRLPISVLADFVADDNNQRKGEIVIVVAGAATVAVSDIEQHDNLLRRLLQDLSVKKTAALAAELTDHKKNALYQRALQLTHYNDK